MTNRPYTTSPIKIILLAFGLVVSLAIPPLAVFLIPYAIYKAVRITRTVKFVRRSRDFYIEESNLMTTSKLFRSGR